MYRFAAATLLILTLTTCDVFSETRKEPALSVVLSGCLLPGTGQFYNGETGKGIIYLAIETISLAFIFAAVEDNVEVFGEQIDVDDDDDTGAFGLLMWTGGRMISAIDAGIAADKINQEKSVSVSPVGGKGRKGIKLNLRF